MDFRELTKNSLGVEARPYLIADTSNGRAVHRCGVAFGNPTGGQGWPHIGGGALTLEEAEAYAKLFAASPEMLRMLERLVYFNKSGDTPNSDPWADAAELIAKVRQSQ